MSFFQDMNIIKAENNKGNNIGALVYQYSLANTLLGKNDDIEFANILRMINNDINKAAEYVNQYNCLILGIGDILRSDMIEKGVIENITNFLKNIKIRVLVVGIGCRRRYWDSVDEFLNKKNTRNIITEFIKECLKHCNIIGIRGFDTANILKQLGFKEDIDFYIMGCPSMFMYGNKLAIKSIPEISNETTFALNKNFNNVYLEYPENNKFFEANIKKYNNRFAVFNSWLYEAVNIHYKDVKYKMKFIDLTIDDYYRYNFTACIDVPTYLNELSKYDYCIGERMHGTAAAIMAGVPSVLISVDWRMEELALYHKIPYIRMNKTYEGLTFEEIIKYADFTEMFKVHEENFKRYQTFFHINSLKTIFDEADIDIENTPFLTRVRKYNNSKIYKAKE